MGYISQLAGCSRLLSIVDAIVMSSFLNHFFMFFRWIAGLMVWLTTYAVLTLLGFGKLRTLKATLRTAWFMALTVNV